VDLKKLQEHIERFAAAVNDDPALEGLVIRLTYSKPEGTNQYVTGIVIGESGSDVQAAIDALSAGENMSYRLAFEAETGERELPYLPAEDLQRHVSMIGTRQPEEASLRPSMELSGEDLAARLVGLMRGGSDAQPFLMQYAEGLEKAAELDDLSCVRVGKQAEAFEEAFRYFAAGFPGAPAVTAQKGELFDFGLYLSRLDRDLRKKLLLGWAGVIRSRA
jgi:hypothetical protein